MTVVVCWICFPKYIIRNLSFFMREGLEVWGVSELSLSATSSTLFLSSKLVAKSKEFQGFFTSFGVIFKHCVQRKLKVQCLPIFTTLSLQRERRIKINPVFGYFQRVFYNHFYWKNLYSVYSNSQWDDRGIKWV